jgi:hypothetical protein
MSFSLPTFGQKVLGSTGLFSQGWQQFLDLVYQILNHQQNSGTSVYSQPTNGQTIQCPNSIETIIADPAAGIAGLTIALPTQVYDGQVQYFSSTKAITTLTVTSTIGAVVPPTVGIAANTGVAYRFIQSQKKWYRCV